MRDGFWICRNISGEILEVLRVENEVDEFVYRDGEWVVSDRFHYELGMDDDWDSVSEEEALEALGIEEW